MGGGRSERGREGGREELFLNCVTVSPDGSLCASGGKVERGGKEGWGGGRRGGGREELFLNCVTVSPDGLLCASVGGDGGREFLERVTVLLDRSLCSLEGGSRDVVKER